MGELCSVVGSIFNELEPRDKICWVLGSFFNELEPWDNICSVLVFLFWQARNDKTKNLEKTKLKN